MPPYEVHVDEERRIVVARAFGQIDQSLAVAMVEEARKAANERGLHILYDMREATPGDMSSGALFWMPRQVQALKVPYAGRVRVALLHPPAYAAMAAYWETAFTNAGLRVKAFTEEEGAVGWLTAPATKA